ncbi:MAG: serine peptidase [Candidatus Manganitrophaceae bacterium]|nr:MAG: serine peptidase [Candidatus Manganitrophaceae bacterium]
MAKRTATKRKGLTAKDVFSTSTETNLTIIYIHGIANKPAPAVLKRQWDLALFGVDMGSRTRMAYWADIRYPQPLPSAATEAKAMMLTGSYRPLSDEEIVDQSKQLAPYGKEAEAFAQKLAKRILAQAKKDQIQAESVEAKILPPWIRRSATEWITKQFIEDVSAYFYNREQRAAIQERFRSLLIPEGGPYFVISHSLGTVISYDVMRELSAGTGAQTPYYITLGSPLGIDEVQDNLQKPLRIPAPVQRWANFADLLDPVAFDKSLSDEFTPTGKITDEIVVNRDSLRISGFNPHSATGYLATRDVQTTVRKIVGSSFAEPLSPFIVARDLAAEMTDPTERFPVLIELKEEMTGRTLEEKRQRLIAELIQLTAKKRDARIDPLRRFVAAELTSTEIDRLAVKHPTLEIARIWKNSEKRALLDKSTQVVQAYTAQLGYGATGRGISWAILDTGIVASHPHFKTYNNIAAQWDCTEVGPPKMGEVTDESGHGTHVAGIIAGSGTGDQAAYRGMAPEAKLHIYKVLDDHGRGSDSWVIKALDHIASINESSPTLMIHGVNLSLGGPFDPTVYGTGFSPLCRELRRLWRMGVVVCIAAGNEGRIVIDTANGEQELNLDLSIGDPANLDEAIAVGSVHKEQPHLYGISYFSSRGPTADGRAKPDLVAPGERIVSCNARFVAKKPATHYVPMSGTSMACPHVSGILAGFLSVRREFIGRPDQVKEILLSHCTDLKRDRYHQGAGMPNLVRMLAET